jgi:hypothetical protein
LTSAGLSARYNNGWQASLFVSRSFAGFSHAGGVAPFTGKPSPTQANEATIVDFAKRSREHWNIQAMGRHGRNNAYAVLSLASAIASVRHGVIPLHCSKRRRLRAGRNSDIACQRYYVF